MSALGSWILRQEKMEEIDFESVVCENKEKTAAWASLLEHSHTLFFPYRVPGPLYCVPTLISIGEEAGAEGWAAILRIPGSWSGSPTDMKRVREPVYLDRILA